MPDPPMIKYRNQQLNLIDYCISGAKMCDLPHIFVYCHDWVTKRIRPSKFEGTAVFQIITLYNQTIIEDTEDFL